MDIRKLVKIQQTFFSGNQTKSLQFRMTALSRLEAGIKKNESEILSALKQDLHKSGAESYMAEVGMTLSELRYVKRHLPFWIRGRRVSTPLVHFPAKSFVIPEPYGVTLIMSPWNYPFMLCMEPLIGAIAAGNCCVLKPSAYAPTVSRVIREQSAAAVTDVAAWLNEMGREVIFLGDGVPVYRNLLQQEMCVPYSFAPAHVNKQRAGAVAALGEVYFSQGKVLGAAEYQLSLIHISEPTRRS